MANLENVMQNNVLASLTGGASRGVVNAIKQASTRTGVNFAYLVKQAAAESSFNPDIKAKTSSATGLYQFIESTWLNMVEKHGDKHGIATAGKSRDEILELRKDPKAASFMAAEFASENEKFLKSHTNGEIGSTELYFAHFLGAPKAASFLNGLKENPLQEAALLFPKAAGANRNVFYDSASGRPKTLQEVYNYFDKKFDTENTTTNSAPSIVTAQKQKPESTASPLESLNHVKSNMRGSHHMALEILGRPPRSNFSTDYNRVPFQRMLANPVELMLLTQLDVPLSGKNSKNPLF